MGGRRQYTGSLTVKVPACRWHKKGCLTSTRSTVVHLTEGNLELRNTEGDTSIAPAGARKGAQTGENMYVPNAERYIPFRIWHSARLSGHVLYIHRIRKSIERHVGGIQGKEISVLPLQEGTSRTGVQTVPANRKVVHLLKKSVSWKN